MVDENKWPLKRKRAAVISVAIMVFAIYLLYSGRVSFQESLRDYVKLVLPFVVLYIVSKHVKEKKKRQEEQEAASGTTFREKHDVKSTD
jgi:Ca2+/Na+ antiporter